jgi:hypothetical protein
MDTLLLFVTVLSLGAAFASVMAVRKLKRHDQLRSDARVAALMAAADETDAPSGLGAEALPKAPRTAAQPAKVSTAGVWNTVAGEMRWAPEPAREPELGFRSERATGRTPNPERLPNPESRIPSPESRIPSPESRVPDSDMAPDAFFGTVQREQPASPRFAFAAAFAVIVALAGAAIVFTTSSHEKTPASAGRAAHSSPLELVSLGHSRDADSLTINGVVRNPADGPKLEGLTAVVSLIDEHGGLISTKDVPLDYRALGPGEEAPFKIMVPDPKSIAKYRVSFRAGTDVVPHVDRRTEAKLASAL